MQNLNGYMKFRIMKNSIWFFVFSGCLFTALISCSKEGSDDFQNINYDAIKSEVIGGKTHSLYKYNNMGRIEEKESIYFYSRYNYDGEGKLIKQESAMDPSLLYSSIIVNRTDLMTAQNSEITSKNYYSYNQEGKLMEIKHYYKENGDFIAGARRDFEYMGIFIVRRNLYNKEGELRQFFVYEYDEKGNVKNEKYYSYNFTTGSEPRLISESIFTYDDKNNPFVIFNKLGIPGLYTNPNNIIETTTISYVETPGIPEYSTSTTTYEYNNRNYPVKVITANSVYEYTYE